MGPLVSERRTSSVVTFTTRPLRIGSQWTSLPASEGYVCPSWLRLSNGTNKWSAVALMNLPAFGKTSQAARVRNPAFVGERALPRGGNVRQGHLRGLVQVPELAAADNVGIFSADGMTMAVECTSRTAARQSLQIKFIASIEQPLCFKAEFDPTSPYLVLSAVTTSLFNISSATSNSEVQPTTKPSIRAVYAVWAGVHHQAGIAEDERAYGGVSRGQWKISERHPAAIAAVHVEHRQQHHYREAKTGQGAFVVRFVAEGGGDAGYASSFANASAKMLASPSREVQAILSLKDNDCLNEYYDSDNILLDKTDGIGSDNDELNDLENEIVDDLDDDKGYNFKYIDDDDDKVKTQKSVPVRFPQQVVPDVKPINKEPVAPVATAEQVTTTNPIDQSAHMIFGPSLTRRPFVLAGQQRWRHVNIRRHENNRSVPNSPDNSRVLLVRERFDRLVKHDLQLVQR
ncbi:conserved hypothetical protein [Culex quinquefasciatus]|uniref:Uncharacterized protein n=1 Tax=Culex quinquefasciatus TaxID=7176 RepID=B0W9T1_CULQU|nr:conserved hypothetical protein [Culex quinquefasciatus]|eukprot:XP_001845465.1 conserved hypothetical protein [Culex quinquefasciatus]